MKRKQLVVLNSEHILKNLLKKTSIFIKIIEYLC